MFGEVWTMATRILKSINPRISRWVANRRGQQFMKVENTVAVSHCLLLYQVT